MIVAAGEKNGKEHVQLLAGDVVVGFKFQNGIQVLESSITLSKSSLSMFRPYRSLGDRPFKPCIAGLRKDGGLFASEAYLHLLPQDHVPTEFFILLGARLLCPLVRGQEALWLHEEILRTALPSPTSATSA